MDVSTEKKIEKMALSYMEKSRPGWNIPHLYAAVFYMRKLIEKEGGDENILLPAIYLHDIGYSGMLEKEYTFEENQKAKKDHMIIGSEMCRGILASFNEFSQKEIEEISHLISIHDNVKMIKTHNEQLVFEADSLAQIDRDMVKPNFGKEDYNRWIRDFKEKRVSIFRTKTGKECLNELMPKAEGYYR